MNQQKQDETEQEQEQQASGESPTEGEATAATTEPAPARRGPGTALGWLATLLALIALAGVAVILIEIRELEHSVESVDEAASERIDGLSARLDRDTAALRDDTAGLRDRLQRLEGLDEQVSARLAEQDETLARIRELAARDQLGWRLAEVRYLLNTGYTRLMLAGDRQSAATAFEAADRILAELADPRLLPLRQAIVDDVQAIRAVEPVDIEGILLRLYNIERNLGALAPANGESAQADPAVDADEPVVERALAWLQSLVVIRHRGAGDIAGLPPGASELPAREAVMLSLENARRAVLAGDQGRYDAALATAIELVERHFNTEAAATARVADALAALQGRPVREQLPDVGDTLDLAAELLPRLATRAAATREDD